MCGIIGYLSTSKGISEIDFNDMRDSMVHRGPDGKGSQFFNNNQIAIGHRRLSIVDLSEAGHQPMKSGDIWITFNGEIYNFKILKKELESKYSFTSSSDTEVILKGYQEWGIKKLLDKIEGMFAFAIYDPVLDKVFLGRDRSGIKPLYYYKKDSEFIFSSELKGITKYPGFKKVLNKEGLYSYFRLRYILGPLTIFKDCSKLLPGSYLEYDCINGDVEIKKYWSLYENSNINIPENENDLIDEIDFLLTSAIESHALTADVPVHTFLSGGIDSSLVSAILSKVSDNISAYSIEVFDEVQNEIEDAKYAANYLNLPLITDKIDSNKFDEIHSEVIIAYDEPLADTSCIPTYFLSNLTSKHVKVALSGDGGDELFYGYKWYEKMQDKEYSFEEYISNMSNTFNQKDIKGLFGNQMDHIDFEAIFKNSTGTDSFSKENFHIQDFHSFLIDDILTKVDIAGMANSLETRIPFLDRKLIEFAFSIRTSKHYKNNELKYLLKKTGEKYLSNKTLYKEKKGFSVPSVNWLSCNYEHNIINGYASKDGVWDKKYLKNLLKGHLHQSQKWLLYNFERWYAFQFHEVKKPLDYKFKDRVKNKLSKYLD